MHAFYNEIEEFPANWMRNLIAAGLLPAGVVDTRSICDIPPEDLDGYGQVNFFAGIGGWPLALRLAGIPDDFPVWTGSCPCQSYSTAGKQNGKADARHLWPEMFRLIKPHRPPIVLGEQVSNAIRFGWLDDLDDDFRSIGYEFSATVLPASCVGAPHIRHRIFWGACQGGHNHDLLSIRRGIESNIYARQAFRSHEGEIQVNAACDGVFAQGCHEADTARNVVCGDFVESGEVVSSRRLSDSKNDGASEDVRARGWQSNAERGCSDAGGISDTTSSRHPGAGQGASDCQRASSNAQRGFGEPESSRADQRVLNSDHNGRETRQLATETARHGDSVDAAGRGLRDTIDTRLQGYGRPGQEPVPQGRQGAQRYCSSSGPWSDYTLAQFRDGKTRRVGTGVQPLAHGVPKGMGRPLAILEGMGLSPAEIKRRLRRPRSILAMASRNRIGRLKGCGSAIVPSLAAMFIEEFVLSIE